MEENRLINSSNIVYFRQTGDEGPEPYLFLCIKVFFIKFPSVNLPFFMGPIRCLTGQTEIYSPPKRNPLIFTVKVEH